MSRRVIDFHLFVSMNTSERKLPERMQRFQQKNRDQVSDSMHSFLTATSDLSASFRHPTKECWSSTTLTWNRFFPNCRHRTCEICGCRMLRLGHWERIVGKLEWTSSWLIHQSDNRAKDRMINKISARMNIEKNKSPHPLVSKRGISGTKEKKALLIVLPRISCSYRLISLSGHFGFFVNNERCPVRGRHTVPCVQRSIDEQRADWYLIICRAQVSTKRLASFDTSSRSSAYGRD